MDKDILEKDLLEKVKQYLDTRLKLEENYINLRQIKKDIYDLKIQKTEEKKSEGEIKNEDEEFELEKGDEEFELEKGNVFLKNYKTAFSSILRKEFNKLDNKKKRELYKTGLLTIRFRLNYLKYDKIKKEDKKTELDKFVFKREDNFPYYLRIKFNEDIQKMFTEKKAKEEELSGLEMLDREREEEERQEHSPYQIYIEEELEYEQSEDDVFNE